MTWWNTFKRTLGLCQPGMHFKKMNGLFGQKKNFFWKINFVWNMFAEQKIGFWKLHAHAYFTWIIWTDILTSKLLIILLFISNYFMLGLSSPLFSSCRWLVWVNVPKVFRLFLYTRKWFIKWKLNVIHSLNITYYSLIKETLQTICIIMVGPFL